MNTLDAIYGRRSIRKYRQADIPREQVEKVLNATIQAPSGKNQQPWRFVVLEGKSKDEVMDRIARAVNEHKDVEGVEGCMWTIRFMRKAPVIIFVFNSAYEREASPIARLMQIQAIGGAIQTMLLAAWELELGSLWVGDLVFASQEVCAYLNRSDEMVAAVALGYPEEEPEARPRMKLDEVTEWRK